ncbi:unnamed protein product [Ascophyllum nodosum]
MDTLIDELKEAPDPDTLTLKVSKSVQQVAQPAFFLRIAERAEMAPDDDQKVAFERLAAQVTGALENLMNFVEEKMDDSSSLLQIIVTSAAEKNGEFIVPLSQERLGSLRQSVKIHRDQLDNNFLATVQAWLERCKREEEMEGMVVILQKILQMYASEAILERKPGPKRRDPGVGDDVPDVTRRTPAGLLLDRILETDAEQWSGILSSLAVPGKGMAGGVTKEGLLGAVQVAVETVVLQQDNGSMAQRVQAEFLSELCKRIETAAPQEQRPPPGILE